MNILYINSVPTQSNANVHINEFINAARQLSVSVEVVNVNQQNTFFNSLTPYRSSSNPKQQLYSFLAGSHLGYFLRDTLNLLNAEKFVHQIVTREKQLFKSNFDFIYCRPGYLDRAALFLANRLQVPLAIEINAPVIYENRLRKRPMPLSKIDQLIITNMLSKAKAVFAVSSILCDYIHREYQLPYSKLFVTPNGVDHNKFSRQIDGNPIRSRYSIPADATVIGFTGSFHSWQGIDLLVDAFSQLQKNHLNTNVYLLLIGYGERYNAINKRIATEDSLGHTVILTGKVPHNQLPLLLATCDICVAPYLPVEMFYFSPLKLFEYMAMGKAIIASDIGQIGEVLTSDSAVLVPPGDVQQLTEAMKTLIHDTSLRKKMGETAYSESLKYTWETNVTKVVNVMSSTH